MQPSRHQRLRLRRILLASIASLLHLLLCWRHMYVRLQARRLMAAPTTGLS